MTKYIVLHRSLVASSPADAAQAGWAVVAGVYDAVRGDDACVQAAEKNDLSGEFRAVPARSWNDPVVIELETTPRAKVVKAAAKPAPVPA